MAVAVQIGLQGTYEQYDQVIQKMGLAPKGLGPAGLLSHFATMADGMLRVVDVWESREQFEQFAQEQIGPFTAEVGIPGPPQMQFFEVHNYFTPNPTGGG